MRGCVGELAALPRQCPLKLWRESLQTGLDFTHEVQGAGDANYVRGLRLTACLRQGYHRVRLDLDRDAMLAHYLCQGVRIIRPRIVEVGDNHLVRHGSQGGHYISDSFIPGQAEDERHPLTRKELCECLPQADNRLDCMRPI